MASAVLCSLNMYESNIQPVMRGVGMIKILLQRQQQQSSDTTAENGETFAPQKSHAVFYIPYESLYDQESRQRYILNALSSTLKSIDSSAICKYLAPLISAFAVWMAESGGVKGFRMLAEVCLSDS